MLANILVLVAAAGLILVFFYHSWKVMGYYDKLGRPLPHPPPIVATSRLTLAFLEILKLDVKVDGRTKEERELIRELSKTVFAARMILMICGLLLL